MTYTRRHTTLLLAAVAATTLPPVARATNIDHYYVGPNNSLFSSPSNWSLTPGGPGGSPPLDQDNAIVSPNTPLSLTVSAAPGSVTLRAATFSASPAAPLTVTQTGTFSTGYLLIGPYTSFTASANSTGNHSGTGLGGIVVDGTNASLSVASPSATLTTHESLSIGNTTAGSFSLSAGYVTVEHPAYVGALGSGAASLTGGNLSALSVYLDSASSASLSQAGTYLTSSVFLGRNASYSLSAGTVSSILLGVKPSAHTFTAPADTGATVIQTGGTVLGAITVSALSPTTPALYTLAGGTVSNPIPSSHPTLTIASAYSGTFLQTGGTVGGDPSFGGDPAAVYVGRPINSSTPATGTYSLSGSSAQLFTDKLYVGYGDHGTFSQSGGSLTLRGASPTLSIATTAGSTGSYSLSGGSLSFNSTSATPSFTIGDAGSATFSHTGGSVSLGAGAAELRLANAPGSSASYSLANSASLSAGTLTVGYSGAATFAQSGGAGTLAPLSVHLGYNAGSSGTYTLSAGALSATSLEAGYSGSGTLSLSGGNASVSNLSLALLAGSTGSLSLTGGTLATTYATVASGGPASVSHSAGSLTVSGTLTLADSYPTSASASYDLSGTGSLRAGRLIVGANPSARASFAQSGGSVSLSSLSIPFAAPGVTHAYSLSAGSLTVSSTSTIAGSLTQSGGSASLPYVTGTGSISLSGTASLSTTTLLSLSLSLAGNASASLGSSSTSTLSSLSIADSATLDLGPSTLLITSNAAAAAPTVRQYLHDGRLTSSSAPLGYVLNAAGNTLTVKPAPRGDANLDGRITPDDYALLDRSLAKHTASALWSDGDFNYDGTVDASDYLLIDQTLGQAQGFGPGFLAQRESQFGAQYVQELMASVPEPASPLACLLAGSLFSRRRQRRPSFSCCRRDPART